MTDNEKEIVEGYLYLKGSKNARRAAVRCLMLETDCDNYFRVDNHLSDLIEEYHKNNPK